MPQTYIRAVGPGAVGRTSSVEVSRSRSGRPGPGSRGTCGPDQDFMPATLPSGRDRPARAAQDPTDPEPDHARPHQTAPDRTGTDRQVDKSTRCSGDRPPPARRRPDPARQSRHRRERRMPPPAAQVEDELLEMALDEVGPVLLVVPLLELA